MSQFLLLLQSAWQKPARSLLLSMNSAGAAAALWTLMDLLLWGDLTRAKKQSWILAFPYLPAPGARSACVGGKV